MVDQTTKRMSNESVHAARDLSDVVGPNLLARVNELGLTRNIVELDLQGYTVIPSLLPDALVAEFREGILKLAAEEERLGKKTFGFGPNTRVMYNVISAAPAIPGIMLNPTLVTLMTYLLGDGYLANLVTASIFRQGALAGPVHSDNEFQPEPFPSWASVATAIWCFDDFTVENGATHIVPRSHHLQRHPRPGEGDQEAPTGMRATGLADSMERRDVAREWSTHGAGERVVLHTSFCRLHIRPFMSFAGVPRDLLDRYPPEFSRLLGFDLPMGFSTEGPNAKAMARAKARVNSTVPWA